MSFIAPRLPANAPFTPEQRAWIDGFVAGLLSGDAGAAPVVAEPSVVAAPVAEAAPPEPASDPEDFPWHEPGLPMDERLTLAAGHPKPRLLMAAMAQQDCGQCGYLCKTYAEAIASGEENSLSRCVPGGKETSRLLKELVTEAPDVPSVTVVAAAPAPAPASGPAALPTKAPQGQAQFQGAFRLTGEGSAKDTRHVVLGLEGSNCNYDVGDALAVFAGNCPELVGA